MAKQYNLKNVDGGEVIKTLASVTPARMAKAMKCLGIKSFHDLETEGGQLKFGLLLMDLIVTEGSLASLLKEILEEGVDDVDVAHTDATVMIGAVQDFFEELPQMFVRRLNT